MADYEQIDAVNWSTLRLILRSPLHYRHGLTVPRKDTPAMAFGRAAHCCVLEADEWARRYVVRPEGIDRRTKDGKAAWEAFLVEAGGREVIDAEDHARCLAIRESVLAHEDARALFVGEGASEQAIVWTDPRTGIVCKGRVDRLSDTPPALVDLKTTIDADAEKVGRKAYDLGYVAQLAWYVDGYREASGAELAPVIVAVEQQAPHDVSVLEFDAEDLAVGRATYRQALDLLAACRASGEWPGRHPKRTRIVLPYRALHDEDGDWTVTEEEAA